MRRILGWALAIAVPAAATAQSSAPTPPAAIETSMPAIDAIFAKYHAEAPVPGLVYGIVKDGRLIHVRGLGVQDQAAKRPVTADSLFRIASMTKAFTALAILSLRDAGKLSLDDLAEVHVPEMRGWRYSTADSPRIRIRDLLHHSAGFVTDDPWGDRQQPLPEADFTRMIAAGVPFTRAPQDRHEYSNFGYALLGRIIANASGIPYRRYVEQTLLTPLGMRSSGYQVTEAPPERRAIGYRWEASRWLEEPTMADGAFGAMGGLQVSANDYAKWVAFLLSAWPARDAADTGPVKRGTVRLIEQGSNFTVIRRRLGATGATACPQSQAYAMGWRAAQDCELGLTLSHGGGYPGYGSHVLLLPHVGVGLFVFTNRTYAPGASGAVWDAAMVLHSAGQLRQPALPISPAIAAAHDGIRRAYRAGEIGPVEDRLAMNFLLDRSADSWRADLGRLKQQVGECPTSGSIIATGALSALFRWPCERGGLQGTILLAPTNPPAIQTWQIEVTP